MAVSSPSGRVVALLAADSARGQLSLVEQFTSAVGVTNEVPHEQGAAVGVVLAADKGAGRADVTLKLVSPASGKQLHSRVTADVPASSLVALTGAFLASFKGSDQSSKYR